MHICAYAYVHVNAYAHAYGIRARAPMYRSRARCGWRRGERHPRRAHPGCGHLSGHGRVDAEHAAAAATGTATDPETDGRNGAGGRGVGARARNCCGDGSDSAEGCASKVARAGLPAVGALAATAPAPAPDTDTAVDAPGGRAGAAAWTTLRAAALKSASSACKKEAASTMNPEAATASGAVPDPEICHRP